MAERREARERIRQRRVADHPPVDPRATAGGASRLTAVVGNGVAGGQGPGLAEEGRGLSNPGDRLWSMAMGLANNFLCFYLHFKRGSDPTTLTQDESASMAERQWIFAYSRIEYPRTLSLIVWRRSSTIVMSVTTLLHAYFQFQAAYASQQGLVSLREVAHQPLQMINVSDTFWVTDDHDFSSQHNVPAAEGTKIFGRRL